MKRGRSQEAEVDAAVALSLRGHAQPRVEDNLAERGLRVVVERHPAIGSADRATCGHLIAELQVRFWYLNLCKQRQRGLKQRGVVVVEKIIRVTK